MENNTLFPSKRGEGWGEGFVLVNIGSSPRPSPRLARRGRKLFCGTVLTVPLQAGLTHLILLRSGDAFINQPLIVTAPFVVLIGTGGHWHFAAF